MAIGPWTGIYSSVVAELMDERKEQQLLLLLAITKYCDPFGFCFPGRIALMRTRHCSQPTYERYLAFLQERNYVAVTETYDYRRRQAQFDFQVSPFALYVRPEIQDYCEAVFDGIQERDFASEKRFLEILFSTKESQPESYPESETRIRKPESGTSSKTRNHNQLRSVKETAEGSTMRNGPKAEQRDSANQRRETQPQKDNLPTGGVEFAALLDPGIDDDRIADEIRLGVGTTPHQAKQAVATYPREGLLHWLEHTMRRRDKGELGKPGGYFFKMLVKHVAPIVIPEPQNKRSV